MPTPSNFSAHLLHLVEVLQVLALELVEFAFLFLHVLEPGVLLNAILLRPLPLALILRPGAGLGDVACKLDRLLPRRFFPVIVAPRSRRLHLQRLLVDCLYLLRKFGHFILLGPALLPLVAAYIGAESAPVFYVVSGLEVHVVLRNLGLLAILLGLGLLGSVPGAEGPRIRVGVSTLARLAAVEGLIFIVRVVLVLSRDVLSGVGLVSVVEVLAVAILVAVLVVEVGVGVVG